MATIDEDLNQFEKDVRTLKIEYEQYFGGGRNRPPSDTQWRVDTLVKRYAERGGDMSYAQRFRYNNLCQTYAKYCDVWRKKLKQKEEGLTERHFGAAARAIEAERVRASAGKAPSSAAPFAMAFSDPKREPQRIEQLYEKLVEARLAMGEKGGTPSLEDFQKFVQQKTEELKNTKGCAAVEYTVSIEGGKVKLKARVSN